MLRAIQSLVRFTNKSSTFLAATIKSKCLIYPQDICMLPGGVWKTFCISTGSSVLSFKYKMFIKVFYKVDFKYSLKIPNKHS